MKKQETLSDEDILAIRFYKDQVRDGKLHPIKYIGNLQDIITN